MQTLNLAGIGDYVSEHRHRVLAVTMAAILAGAILFAGGVAFASDERETAEAPAGAVEQYRTMDRADVLDEYLPNVAGSPAGEARAMDAATMIEALRNEGAMSNPGQTVGTLRTQDTADTIESLKNTAARSNSHPTQAPVRLPRH